MSLTGKTILHYEILERLGRGGMGEVYRARDMKLGRVVALKFLPGHLTADDQAKARLIQEAGAASALDHPNICTIHEIGDTSDSGEGGLYVAMTYYPGRTVRELLSANGDVNGKPLSRETALEIARQIAAGLAAAHRKGIVHRDIKPENIIVTDEHRAVLLDFGVAKLAGATRLTQEGAAPGTIAYMSPEQARGESVGPATDIWAVGVVLYEMLTGRRPFKGDYDQAIIYSILNTDPVHPEGMDAGSWSVLERALAKDPDTRYGSMDAFSEALSRLRVPDGDRAAARRRPVGVALVVLAISATLTLLLVVGKSGSGGRQNGEGGFPNAMGGQFRQITFAAEVEEFPAFDPEGKRIAFSRESNDYRHIFIHDLESGAEVQLTAEPRDDIEPAWSSDGRSLVFVRSNDPSGKIEPGDVFAAYLKGDIWKLEIEGGVSRRIIDDGFNPTFSPDGAHIVFDADWAGPRRIWVSDAEGRNPQQLTSGISEEVEHVSPGWSPDGRFVAFVSIQRTKFDIQVVNVETREISVITDDAHTDVYPVFAGDGRGIFFASNRAAGMNIWYAALDEKGLLQGEPRQLSSGAGHDVQLALSRDGSKLAYSVLGINSDLWRLPVDSSSGRATGQPVPLVSTTREDSRPSWSHDDSRIAFNSDRTGDMNIWVHDPDQGGTVQITRGAGGDYQPRWSPDDSKLVFFSSRAGNADIWAVDLESRELVQLTADESLDINPEYSPDGRMIAFLSDRGGRREVWVMGADGTDERQLTTIGASGHFLMWTRDSERVVFRSDYEGVPTAMAVPAAGGPPEPQVPVRGGSHMSWGPNYDVIADVTDHKVLWITPLNGEAPRKIFEFEDLDVRVDYPVWSHDGRWIVFDRVKPSGGDVWIVELQTASPG